MKNVRKNEEKDTKHLKTSTPQKGNQERDLREDKDLREDRDLSQTSREQQSDKKNAPGRGRA